MNKIDGILIAGQMYSGKTIAAEYICELLGYKKFSFARSLKHMASRHYNNGEMLSKAATYPVYIKDTKSWVQMNGRDIFAKLGEAIKNGFDYSWFYVEESIFVKEFFKEQKEYFSHRGSLGCRYDGFVMDDNRFEEEYLYFRDQFNVKLIYIETNEEERIRRAIIRDGIIPTQDQLNSNTEKLAWASKYADIRIVNEYTNEKDFFGGLEPKIYELDA